MNDFLNHMKITPSLNRLLIGCWPGNIIKLEKHKGYTGVGFPQMGAQIRGICLQ